MVIQQDSAGNYGNGIESCSKKKVVSEDTKPKSKIVNFSSTHHDGYFHKEVRHPHNSTSVKITANTHGGPFISRKYVNKGGTPTLVVATHKTLAGAIRWANDKLGTRLSENTFGKFINKMKEAEIDTGEVVPDFEMAEIEAEPDLVPTIGTDDRLFIEDDDELVPSDIALNGHE